MRSRVTIEVSPTLKPWAILAVSFRDKARLSLRYFPQLRGALGWTLTVCSLVLCLPALAQSRQELEQQFLKGRYDEVIAASEKKAQTGGYDDGWRVLQVKALLMRGRYGEARTNANAGVEDFPASMRLRLLAREADLFENDFEGANRMLNDIKELLQRRWRFDQSGENLVAVGQALLLLGVEPRLALENCFQRAYSMEPPVRDAYLASGQLALDKHDFAMAAEAFRAGLKKFPDDADLQCGLAHAFENGDPEEMLKALDAALATNPRHIPSLLLLADHMMDAEEYEEAEKQIDRVLNVNPWRPEALAYRSAMAQIRHDLAAAEQARAKALTYWTNNPQVDYLIGQKLAQHYLFAEGAAAQRRALALQSDYLPARRELAEDLLRLGQDEDGWKLAQEAHDQDPYDVTAYNLTTLHDEMEKFSTLTNADFILSMSPREAQIYGDSALELLERARTVLCQKYAVVLPRPTVVEIFPAQKDFAVRTFGLPGNPGYLGVCFGSVITANSPASQGANPSNWQDVLWHEFCHVVTLTETHNRMPRWLSEGISVYEERQADPAWGQTMNLAYRDLVLGGKLTPLGQLSGAFMQAKNGEALQFAYYESSLAVEFIVQNFGLETLKKILLDLRDGRETYQAMAARTLPIKDLEKKFEAFARERAKNLAPGADLDKPPEAEEERATWEKLHPENFYVRMEKARQLMESRQWTEAQPLLEALAKAYHGERRAENPLWLQAVTERNLNHTNAEWLALRELAEQEADFVDLELRLIELTAARKDWKDETKYAQRLLQINPLLAAPYRALAEAGLGAADKEQAIAAYRKLLLLDPPDPVEAHFQLARLLHERGDAESEAKRHVLQALEEAPRYRAAQQLLLEIEAAAKPSNHTAAVRVPRRSCLGLVSIPKAPTLGYIHHCLGDPKQPSPMQLT